MSEFPAWVDRRGGLRRPAPGAAVSRAPAARTPPARVPELPFDLAIFEGVVDPALLRAAARRARRLDVGVDEVLRAHGILTPDQIAAATAAGLGVPLAAFDDDRTTPPLQTAATGVLLQREADGTGSIVVAPRGHGIRRLAAAVKGDRGAAAYLRIAAPERLAAHVRAAGADALAEEAVSGLRDRRPDLSAVGGSVRRLHWFPLLFGASVLATAAAAHEALFIAIMYFLALTFVAWTALRLAACFTPPPEKPRIEIPDRRLPVYTIIVPLYGEAAVVAQLIAAIRRLDYPPEKLDVKIVLEEDDADTRAAVAHSALAAPFEVVVAPRAGPRTKPKALAATLPFARGRFVTVYDAEDEPDPQQLRDALAAFAADPGLACVQAKLAVDNVGDSWFSRHFTIEYAGLFEVFLPALAKFAMPLPLGGTSNHFRTDVLREVGGWDPFNVTEDADLGMRLARFGHRTGTVDSQTWEEAPVGLVQWMRQRTRWFKGWMQTWIVHMRRPLLLRGELGLRGFLALQLLVGGTVLAALVHPFFMGLVVHDAWTGAFFTGSPTSGEAANKWLALAVLGAGYYGSVALGLVGLRRRGLLRVGWTLVTIPLYWLMLSAAAWRALFQLVYAPHRWEKTGHGLARSSVRGAER